MSYGQRLILLPKHYPGVNLDTCELLGLFAKWIEDWMIVFKDHTSELSEKVQEGIDEKRCVNLAPSDGYRNSLIMIIDCSWLNYLTGHLIAMYVLIVLQALLLFPHLFICSIITLALIIMMITGIPAV